jgi:hypothetical protein
VRKRDKLREGNKQVKNEENGLRMELRKREERAN